MNLTVLVHLCTFQNMGPDFIFPNRSLSDDPAVIISPDLLLADVEHWGLEGLKNIYLQSPKFILYSLLCTVGQ